MDLGATLFPRSAPWSPEYCEDGDGHQNLMQLTWAPGFDQSRPDGVDLRIDAWIAGRDNVRESATALWLMSAVLAEAQL